MKKVRIALLFISIVAVMFQLNVCAERPIKIVVGGEKIDSDVAPIIVDGRTMLPVRAVFESIGAKVSYDGNTKKVIANKRGKTVELVIGSNTMTVNGEEKTLDVPATIVNSRTLVPVRACAEAFDLDVEWIDKTRTVKIKKEVSLLLKSCGTGGCPEYTYDARGNAIYCVDGFWRIKYTYDENNNMILRESWYDEFGNNSYYDWERYSYDEYGNIIYVKRSDGNWEKYIYDDFDNEIYYENSYYNEWRKSTYDSNGKGTYYETSDGDWGKNTYDSNGNLIFDEHFLSRWNSIYFNKYTYDENGNEIYREDSSGYWEKRQYDSNGNETYYEDSDGGLKETTYDSNGNEVCRKGFWHERILGEDIKLHSYWERRVYDENGNNTFYEGTGLLDPYDHYGEVDLYGWYKYVYNEYGDLIYWEDSSGNSGELKYDENGNLLYEEDVDGGESEYIVMVK